MSKTLLAFTLALTFAANAQLEPEPPDTPTGKFVEHAFTVTETEQVPCDPDVIEHVADPRSRLKAVSLTCGRAWGHIPLSFKIALDENTRYWEPYPQPFGFELWEEFEGGDMIITTFYLEEDSRLVLMFRQGGEVRAVRWSRPPPDWYLKPEYPDTFE